MEPFELVGELDTGPPPSPRPLRYIGEFCDPILSANHSNTGRQQNMGIGRRGRVDLSLKHGLAVLVAATTTYWWAGVMMATKSEVTSGIHAVRVGPQAASISTMISGLEQPLHYGLEEPTHFQQFFWTGNPPQKCGPRPQFPKNAYPHRIHSFFGPLG